MAASAQDVRARKSLILCFDGTGNKFQGNGSDSNIVKIFSLLDRQDPNQFHYYQPGIGTYVETGSLARKSRFGRMRSWYLKAKDQAIGTSFGEHVMAGYKFLMRYYNDGDAIYFFGFSRGAYTARFLAQMLDYVGLLSAGNEEMLRFAWKTFASWQMRGDSEDDKSKKHAEFEFMKRFRETFSRPVCRIEFLGLFDCVNSVPQFESAWMSRTRFPYTAKTTACVIRHAVSIDERRAKFRQDLLSERRETHKPEHHHLHSHLAKHEDDEKKSNGLHKLPTLRGPESQQLFRTQRRKHLDVNRVLPDSASISQVSVNSQTIVEHRQEELNKMKKDGHDVDADDGHQDILEVWFAGQHGDIGGGWNLGPNEHRPLSDIPLMWMLREARKAGMPFDEEKVGDSNLFTVDADPIVTFKDAPILQVEGEPLPQNPRAEAAVTSDAFAEEVHRIATESIVHDSLRLGGGMGWMGVAAWQFMEWLPFRRMDLQPDGSWRAISWPLPRGEVRDMSSDCKIHGSVIKRMQANPNYRPGNLIIGGGGRGVRVAPASYGTGRWDVCHEHGNIIGEVYVKAVEANGK